MNDLYLNKEVVNYYKGLKGIKYDSDLLRKIGKKLNYKDETLENFVSAHKSNFSKMLKGKRKLNADYIIPLEKILGIPIAKLVDPEAYKFIINKEEVPFVKGIKYYAYKDDMDLYINELSKLTDICANPIICNEDEYRKTFIDYVVEYNSVNAIKFLHNEYQIKLQWWHNIFEIKNQKHKDIIFKNTNYLIRMIANMNDPQLFFDIYDTYNMFLTNGHYGGTSGIFESEDFIKAILDNEHLLNDALVCKEYIQYTSHFSKKCNVERPVIINSINPIINVCLRYAIENIEQYKKQALDILHFAIKYNKQVINRLDKSQMIYEMNELGGLYSKDGKKIIDLLIYYNGISDIQEIQNLINKLPKREINHFKL